MNDYHEKNDAKATAATDIASGANSLCWIQSTTNIPYKDRLEKNKAWENISKLMNHVTDDESVSSALCQCGGYDIKKQFDLTFSPLIFPYILPSLSPASVSLSSCFWKCISYSFLPFFFQLFSHFPLYLCFSAFSVLLCLNFCRLFFLFYLFLIRTTDYNSFVHFNFV